MWSSQKRGNVVHAWSKHALPYAHHPVTEPYLVGSLRRFRPSAAWPVHITRVGRCSTYVAGYGDGAEDVAEAIRLAVLNVAIGLYDQRRILDNLLGAQQAALRPYRIERQPFRFAKGLEPPELLAQRLPLHALLLGSGTAPASPVSGSLRLTYLSLTLVFSFICARRLARSIRVC